MFQLQLIYIHRCLPHGNYRLLFNLTNFRFEVPKFGGLIRKSLREQFADTYINLTTCCQCSNGLACKIGIPYSRNHIKITGRICSRPSRTPACMHTSSAYEHNNVARTTGKTSQASRDIVVGILYNSSHYIKTWQMQVLNWSILRRPPKC